MTKTTKTKTKLTARPAVDQADRAVLGLGDLAHRQGAPSSYVRNEAGELVLVPDAELDADLDDELDAQHEAELADKVAEADRIKSLDNGE